MENPNITLAAPAEQQAITLPPTEQGLLARLEQVQGLLDETNDDLSRFRIRDEAKAITAMAAALHLEELQVGGSIAVCRAEKAIAFANDTILEQFENGKRAVVFPGRGEMSVDMARDISDLRYAYRLIKDDEFELACQSAKRDGAPLRRGYFTSLSKQRRDEQKAQKERLAAYRVPKPIIKAVIAEVVKENDAIGAVRTAEGFISELEKAGRAGMLKDWPEQALDLLGNKDFRITSLTSAVKRLWRDYLRDNPIPPPPGRYDVVVLDPPWEINPMNISESRSEEFGEQHYPTMTIEDVRELKIGDVLADDAWVLLWVRPWMLHGDTAIDLLRAWGVQHRFTLIWRKTGPINGYKPPNRPRINWEPCLVGSKGNPLIADDTAFWECFEGDATGHSVKPAEFYNTVRRCFMGDARLDMFNRRPLEGFDTWGNQAAEE